jgi:hypothetical protein
MEPLIVGLPMCNTLNNFKNRGAAETADSGEVVSLPGASIEEPGGREQRPVHRPKGGAGHEYRHYPRHLHVPTGGGGDSSDNRRHHVRCLKKKW